MSARVLITGSTGVVGTALRAELVAHGYGVTALSRADADLTRLDETCAAFEAAAPELVFHLAGRVAGLGGNMIAPGAMYFDNVLINTHVIEAARRVGARKIVAAGTCAIYADGAPLPISERDVWLGAPHGSEAAYGHAKRAMLAQLDAYRSQYGLDFAYAVLTNMYGPGDRFDEAYGHVAPSLVSKFHRAKATGGAVTVWGDGTAERDFLYSRDAARALRLLAERGQGVVNVASGRVHTIADLVAAIAYAARFEGEIMWDKDRPTGQRRRRYDLSRLAALGFTPGWSLESGIAETYDWFDRNAAHLRR